MRWRWKRGNEIRGPPNSLASKRIAYFARSKIRYLIRNRMEYTIGFAFTCNPRRKT